jgi:transcriptional regulator with XRE-family HTH domain
MTARTEPSTPDSANGSARPRFGGAGPALVGQRLRDERERQNIGVRSLAGRLGVSASLISQVERGKVMPSVGTLYAIVRELGLSMDTLFVDNSSDRGGAAAEYSGPVQRRDTRKTLRLASGVRWERLTATPDSRVAFNYLFYEVGAESCPADALVRHDGREYGYVLEGRLGVTIDYESYELSPGDSVSYHSNHPHRLWNAGTVAAVAIWCIVGRQGDDHVP